jgi:hypothetical protein
MNQIQLITRSRNLVRDLTNAFFREQDVVAYLNEGMERVGQVIPELVGMTPLGTHLQEVELMPKHYQHLLALYCAARLCTQDERHYQAATFMNEFEIKLAELADKIINGDIEILDEEGNLIYEQKAYGHVKNEYYNVRGGIVRQYRKYAPNDWEEDDI